MKTMFELWESPMKRTSIFKWSIRLGAGGSLALLTKMAISAVATLPEEFNANDIFVAMQNWSSQWHGSKFLIAVAAVWFVLAVAGRGLERR